MVSLHVNECSRINKISFEISRWFKFPILQKIPGILPRLIMYAAQIQLLGYFARAHPQLIHDIGNPKSVCLDSQNACLLDKAGISRGIFFRFELRWYGFSRPPAESWLQMTSSNGSNLTRSRPTLNTASPKKGFRLSPSFRRFVNGPAHTTEKTQRTPCCSARNATITIPQHKTGTFSKINAFFGLFAGE